MALAPALRWTGQWRESRRRLLRDDVRAGRAPRRRRSIQLRLQRRERAVPRTAVRERMEVREARREHRATDGLPGPAGDPGLQRRKVRVALRRLAMSC